MVFTVKLFELNFYLLKLTSLRSTTNQIMHQLQTAARLALTTGLLAGVVAWIALQMQLIPSKTCFNQEYNYHTADSLASTLSAEIERGQQGNAVIDSKLREIVRTSAALNPSIDQIQLTDPRGQTVFKTASKSANSSNYGSKGNTNKSRSVTSLDLMSGREHVGGLKVCFDRSMTPVTHIGVSRNFRVIGFLAGAVSLMCWFLFSYAMRFLSPSEDIPRLAIAALDTLTKGVVLLTPSGKISHCNDAFCELISGGPDCESVCSERMVGHALTNYGWQVPEPNTDSSFAWDRCIEFGETVVGEIVTLKTQSGNTRLLVNASPILTDNGACQGALLSFGDVTETENQRAALEKTLATVEEQNHQLSFLASYDTLTSCLNRREFFTVFDKSWAEANREELTLLMLDVDSFKAINDTRGHSFGDKVLVHVAEQIREAVGDLGTVCRYGGEEFVVLLSNLELERAVDVAHKIRKSIEAVQIDGEVVTISIGLSNRQFKAMDQQHLLDQADQALYAAKRTGRNRVVRFDQCPTEAEMAIEPSVEVVDARHSEVEYSAVIGLLSSLSFRCRETANHSIRVADLAVKIGREFVGNKDLYLLEVAALLHDVGKIGVPDAVLYKPGPLDPEELEVMNRHYDVGLQIVGNTINSTKLLEILRCRHYGYEPSHARQGQKLFREGIPVLSRVLYVCDVFDTLVSDRAFREQMLIPEALVEMLKCSPGQFDLEIVRCLVKHVEEHGYEQTQTGDWLGIDPRSAVGIGSHVEVVYQALETRNLYLLREASRSLRTQASKAFVYDLVEATIDLEEAVNGEFPEDQIHEIANDVMALCRETRQSLTYVPRAEEPEAEVDSSQTPSI